MQEIRFTVWQFVRLMVQAEETIKTDRQGGVRKLFDAWEDIWVELDAKLLDLGHNNPDSFADLMMNQEVCCDDISSEERMLIIQELQKVVAGLKTALSRTGEDQAVENLTFEHDELRALIKSLKTDATDRALHGLK